MTEKELTAAILAEHEFDDAAIDDACIKRLKRVCDGYGREGEMARKMLCIVEDVLAG
jgi:hypothetical protein